MTHPSIAIIGAGFSGTLLSLQLLRHCSTGTTIRLIKRNPEPGPGLAYATTSPSHLLNVPAGRMSAFPDQPSHFLEWLQRQPAVVLNGPVPEAASFVPRRLFGLYVRGLLAEALRTSSPGRLEIVRGAAVGIERRPGGLTLRFEQGEVMMPDIVVIATGNSPPVPPMAADQFVHETAIYRETELYRGDPWAGDIAEDLPRDGAVLLIGTGLTMVDAALHLLDRGHVGPIHALSRRGLLPHVHALTAPAALRVEAGDVPRGLSGLLRFVRTQCEIIGEAGGTWHAAIDALRPITQEIWRDWDPVTRRRFLRHVRPWWDIYRHRMAGRAAERIASARESGQLRIHAGRICRLAIRGGEAEAIWRPRGETEMAALRVRRIVNCTGPASDVACSTDRLSRALLLEGLARPDPARLGFDATIDGALRDRDGDPSDRLFGIGPVCRSALWEITAVPDIRVQCESLARRIASFVTGGVPAG